MVYTMLRHVGNIGMIEQCEKKIESVHSCVITLLQIVIFLWKRRLNSL